MFKATPRPVSSPAPAPLSPQQATAVAMVASLKSGEAGVVDSRAGSGKTHTLVAAVRALPRAARVLVLTYNKAIREELAVRLPSNAEVRTYHAFAQRVCDQAGLLIQPPGPSAAGPSWGWVKENVPSSQLRRSVVNAAEKFRNLALTLIDDVPSDAELVETLQDFAVKLPKRPEHRVKVVQYAKALLADTQRRVESATTKVTVEFDDMLWLAARFGDWVAKYDFVLVDEAQDSNPVQCYLLAGAIVSGRASEGTLAPLTVVGDPFQAINGWRAAGRGPLEDVVARVGSLVGVDLVVRQAPLTVSWRCPRSHIDLARLRRPIDPAPAAILGEVAFGRYADALTFIQPGDTVLSRTNAPLVDLALRLLSVGRHIEFPGTDVLTRVKALITKTSGSENVTLARLKQILSQRLVELIGIPEAERLFEHDQEIDTYGVAVRLVSELRSLDDLEPLLARFASKAADRICLLSVHRAKGKEWDRVVLYGFEAKTRKNLPEWLQDQETNLSYVALTRAKKWLGFLESEEGQGFPKDIVEGADERIPEYARRNLVRDVMASARAEHLGDLAESVSNRIDEFENLAESESFYDEQEARDLTDLACMAASRKVDPILGMDLDPDVEYAYRLLETRRHLL